MLPDELRGGRLGAGLGSQQGLHARLVPIFSSQHKGSATLVGLQVRVGRVMQQDEYDTEVAVACSSHERGEAEVGWQVDAPSRSPGGRWPRRSAARSPICADRWISTGSDAGELIAARGRLVPLEGRIRVAPPASVQPLVRTAPALGAAAESRSGKPSRARSLQRGGGAFINVPTSGLNKSRKIFAHSKLTNASAACVCEVVPRVRRGVARAAPRAELPRGRQPPVEQQR
eukprot:scaffold34597_cov60-Phaeocystis_antarctica.AAC.2